MDRRKRLSIFLASFLSIVATADVFAQSAKPKEVLWTHAFDLASRKFGEVEFTKTTQKFGVEAFKDQNNGLGIYLSQVGSLAITGRFDKLMGAVEDSKGPEWLTGLDLPSRKAGEKEFSKSTKSHAMEVFRDPNTENWIYVTENGHLAVAPVRGKTAGGSQAPKWVHSVDLSARKGGVKEWKDATSYGIEVYRDLNTGNLLFICETGSLAVAPELGEVKIGAGKAPDWLHGLDLACRKSTETSFSKSTKKLGVEVFRDETTGYLIFISEAGKIAVAPAPAGLKAPTANVKEPVWTHGFNLKCRAFGEKEFSKDTRVFGGEVFRDDNVQVFISINDQGGLSALTSKK